MVDLGSDGIIRKLWHKIAGFAHKFFRGVTEDPHVFSDVDGHGLVRSMISLSEFKMRSSSRSFREETVRKHIQGIHCGTSWFGLGVPLTKRPVPDNFCEVSYGIDSELTDFEHGLNSMMKGGKYEPGNYNNIVGSPNVGQEFLLAVSQKKFIQAFFTRVISPDLIKAILKDKLDEKLGDILAPMFHEVAPWVIGWIAPMATCLQSAVIDNLLPRHANDGVVEALSCAHKDIIERENTLGGGTCPWKEKMFDQVIDFSSCAGIGILKYWSVQGEAVLGILKGVEDILAERSTPGTVPASLDADDMEKLQNYLDEFLLSPLLRDRLLFDGYFTADFSATSREIWKNRAREKYEGITVKQQKYLRAVFRLLWSHRFADVDYFDHHSDRSNFHRLDTQQRMRAVTNDLLQDERYKEYQGPRSLSVYSTVRWFRRECLNEGSGRFLTTHADTDETDALLDDSKFYDYTNTNYHSWTKPAFWDELNFPPEARHTLMAYIDSTREKAATPMYEKYVKHLSSSFRPRIKVELKGLLTMGLGEIRRYVKYSFEADDLLGNPAVLDGSPCFLGGKWSSDPTSKCYVSQLSYFHLAGNAGQSALPAYQPYTFLKTHQDSLDVSPLPITNQTWGGVLPWSEGCSLQPGVTFGETAKTKCAYDVNADGVSIEPFRRDPVLQLKDSGEEMDILATRSNASLNRLQSTMNLALEEVAELRAEALRLLSHVNEDEAAYVDTLSGLEFMLQRGMPEDNFQTLGACAAQVASIDDRLRRDIFSASRVVNSTELAAIESKLRSMKRAVNSREGTISQLVESESPSRPYFRNREKIPGR